MTVKILSIGLRGLEGYRVQVEVQEVPGIAAIQAVEMTSQGIVVQPGRMETGTDEFL
ncbi:hypothetical protein P4532_14255 [Geobacillus stearothermophilus]|uniref:hypothetical protein n=1 Tax=Geobacillus stearothermophilus TaxID=1422 RepID=UPI002E22C179|nr:hypothetical protein [Geobacillus stearothermophilus]